MYLNLATVAPSTASAGTAIVTEVVLCAVVKMCRLLTGRSPASLKSPSLFQSNHALKYPVP